MSGSILTSGVEQYQALWRDYWGSRWHHPVLWPRHRLACLLNAETARQDVNGRGDALVSDFPRGRRPLLGVLTNSLNGEVSPESGVLEYNEDGHILTIAPTRAGKGAGQILPNLILYAGSTLVVDIKRENYDITAKHRSTFFDGATVHKFAPFDDDTARYNPLDFIRVNEDGSASSYTFDDARLLAEMLVGSKSTETFWDIEARGIVTMLLCYVATRYRPGHGDRVMHKVVELLFPQPLEGDSAPPFDRTSAPAELLSQIEQQKATIQRLQQAVSNTSPGGNSAGTSETERLLRDRNTQLTEETAEQRARIASLEDELEKATEALIILKEDASATIEPSGPSGTWLGVAVSRSGSVEVAINQSSSQAAFQAAEALCREKGGQGCRALESYAGGCVAVARQRGARILPGNFWYDNGASPNGASARAERQCVVANDGDWACDTAFVKCSQ